MYNLSKNVYLVLVLFNHSINVVLHSGSTQYCMVTGFSWLLNIEQLSANISKDVFAKTFRKKQPFSFLTGSHAQASSSAGWFFVPDNYSKESYVMNIDVDIVDQLMSETFPRHCVHDIANKPGYLRLLSSCLPDWMAAKFEFERNESEYLQTYHVKYSSQNKWLTKNKPNVTNFRFLYRLISGSKAIMDLADWRVLVKKATCQITYSFHINGEPAINFTMDYAILLKTAFQPTVMKDFIKMTTFSIPEKLSKYIHVIPKPSLQEKNNDNTTEWSYSFSHIENHIFSHQLTEIQTLVYLIFKSVMNKWLKPLDPDTLSSYIAKTLLFWKCHHLPPGHPYWNETSSGVLTAVQGLFEDFLHHLRSSFLPSYFIPQMNVIEKFTLKLQKQCINQIENVILPNMSGLIEWSELKEIIRLIELAVTYEQKHLDYLNFHWKETK